MFILNSRPEPPMMLHVELPSRCGNDNHHPDFSTSSEDEDESVLGDPAQVMVPYSVLTARSQVCVLCVVMVTISIATPTLSDHTKYVRLFFKTIIMWDH